MESGSYGAEVSWSLDTTCTSGATTPSNSEKITTCHLLPGEYTLVCSDSYGDGWNGAQVTIQGVKYCDNFNSGSEMQVQLIITNDGSISVNANGVSGNRHYVHFL